MLASAQGEFYLSFLVKILPLLLLTGWVIQHIRLQHQSGQLKWLVVALMSLMNANLDALFWPVLLYMLVILLMSMASWMTSHSNTFLVLGGLSFILSDSLIGLTKFYQPMEYAGTAIMVTYYLAQFALVTGFLRRHTQQMNPGS